LLRFTAAFVDKKDNPDYSVLYFNDKATIEFNGQTDALKMMNTDKDVPSLYSIMPNQVNTSIKAIRYNADTTYNIPLGVKILRNGNVIFKLKDVEGDFLNMVKISIFDKEKDIEQDLMKGGEYQANLKTGDYQNRFYLRFTNTQTSLTTAVENNISDDFFKIYCSHGGLRTETNTNGQLIIYNLSGQMLFNTEIQDSGFNEYVLNLNEGIYFATFYSGNLKSTKKFIFKR
jgi:hypothetical protein